MSFDKGSGRPNRLLISHERLKELVSYDSETGIFIRIKGTALRRPGDVIGYKSDTGHVDITVDRIRYQAHRLAWFYVHGEWPDSKLDHENLDPSDNRIKNLRLADDSQNTQNNLMPSRNTSGAKGVRKYDGKFKAAINLRGKTHWLGTFDSLDEAAHAYNKGAIRLHGEFAVLNPIGTDY